MSACDACHMLGELYESSPQTDRLYWVMTEIFVRLHGGSDVCSLENRNGGLTMRRVRYYEYEKMQGKTYHDKVLRGEALFHGWGVDYEELDTGAGNYSTAIIELDDGTVRNMPVEMVEFLEAAQ